MTSFGELGNRKQKLPVDLPGLDENMRIEAEKRIEEFENEHLQNVLLRGEGWVPKIKNSDFLIASVINIIAIILLIIGYN